MGNTYTRIVYQVVFATKYRQPTLSTKEGRTVMFKQMNGVLKNKRCTVYQINGVEDHVHLAFALHPSVALASLVKDLKLAASHLIKERGFFPEFCGWQTGYGAFTYTPDALKNLIPYIQNQEDHHRKKETSANELRRLLHENGIEFNERYFE